VPRILLALFAILATYASNHTFAEKQSQLTEQLVLLNWDDYMDAELLQEFERLHNIQVKEIYYESDDTRNSILAASNGKGYDLAIVNEAMIESYNDRGWIASIPQPQPDNFQHIDASWVDIYPNTTDKAIPLLWGTLGIGYRADLVSQPLATWSQFFNPDESLTGRLGLMNSSRDVMGMALKSLGYSINSTNLSQLTKAAALLKRQLPFVKSYRYLSLDETSDILNGELYASMMYGGDALMLQELNNNIQYVIPQEGTNIWIDYLVVFSASKKQDMAWKFINFLHDPKRAASLSQYLYTATTNKTAKKYLPEYFLNNKTIYPPKGVLEKSEYFNKISPRALNKINTLFLPVFLSHSE
jgi:spermidine/putrescine transport system substrate-binding protein